MNFEEKVYSFLHILNQFQYHYEHNDRIWDIIFFHKKRKWHRISVRQYHDTFYINLVDNDICILEVIIGKSIVGNITYHPYPGQGGKDDLEKTWGEYIDSAHHWLKNVQHNWIKANALAAANYPLNCRTGYVSHALVRASLSGIYRLDQILGQKKIKKFIKIVESNYFHDSLKTMCSTMTAKQYFDYCKVAYIAAQEKGNKVDKNLSGKELYERYADGRHEGLLDIDLDSADEFSAWLDGTHPKRTSGGHPWEIKRGENTTHIDLFVSRPRYSHNNGFIVTICAPAITRLAEAIRMFLALYDAGLPIKISDPDVIYRRLLAQDNIGIVPKYSSLHRANQDYPENQDVHDVMHYDDFGRYKKRIKPFIIWEPLPILVPVHFF